MNPYKFLFSVGSFLILSSCSLSKTFHKPQKMIASIDKLTYIISKQDTTYIEYTQSTKEINFFTPKKKAINKNYTIKDTFLII